jgi:hypothetical protein
MSPGPSSAPEPAARREAEAPPDAAAASVDPLPGLWEHALARWGDERAHDAFLEHCRAAGRLGEAARRYRHELESEARHGDADGREIARRRLAAIGVLALAELQASRVPPEDAHRGWRVAVWLLGAALFAAALVTLWLALR